ncbi:MAG TPA: GDSL-type esterase/lipase family protein [Polyangiaceae bacterium]
MLSEASLRLAEAACHDRRVRWTGGWVLFALAAACGDRGVTPRDPAGVADRQPPPVAPPSASPAGHLEGRERLQHLFEAFERIDRDVPERVRIAQFGDSHTASDLGVSVFRRELQARFGDGGRGFVSVGKPWNGYWERGVHVGMSDGFAPVKVKFHAGAFEGLDGAYGLLGVGVAASAADERAWTEIADAFTHVELDGWRQPGGGSFDVSIDGAPAGRVATRGEPSQSAFWGLDVAEGPHRVEVRTVGDGEVRLFGMTLDRGRGGVVVDTLGINGAQIFTPLRWSEAHFAEQLRHRAPDLVILAYGTNEAVEPKLTDSAYELGIVEMLGRVSRAVPTASCLLLGPPDLARRATPRDPWATTPRVLEIVEIQRRVAQAAGCAFFDQLAAMGGPGSMAAWAAEAEPRALRDRVHLSRDGYAQVGAAFADDLLRAYDAWSAERGLPLARAPKTWGGAVH